MRLTEIPITFGLIMLQIHHRVRMEGMIDEKIESRTQVWRCKVRLWWLPSHDRTFRNLHLPNLLASWATARANRRKINVNKVSPTSQVLRHFSSSSSSIITINLSFSTTASSSSSSSSHIIQYPIILSVDFGLSLLSTPACHPQHAWNNPS